MAKSKIRYSKTAIKQIAANIEYIRDDSPQNAERVYKKLMDKLENACLNPEANPADKYKTLNDGSYRSFLVFRFRVSYKIKKYEILVLRIRHTSMKPRFY